MPHATCRNVKQAKLSDRAEVMRRVHAYNASHPSMWLVPLAYTIIYAIMHVQAHEAKGYSETKIAEITGCDARTVRRLLPVLERLGVAITYGCGRRLTNVYRIGKPDTGVLFFGAKTGHRPPKKRTPVSGFPIVDQENSWILDSDDDDSKTPQTNLISSSSSSSSSSESESLAARAREPAPVPRMAAVLAEARRLVAGDHDLDSVVSELEAAAAGDAAWAADVIRQAGAPKVDNPAALIRWRVRRHLDRLRHERNRAKGRYEPREMVTIDGVTYEANENGRLPFSVRIGQPGWGDPTRSDPETCGEFGRVPFHIRAARGEV